MNDTEINRKLALAIGWKPKQIKPSGTAVFVLRYQWCVFDFRHWQTICPIAQRYDCFPFNSGGGWCAYAESVSRSQYSDTPQKAIALSVIAAHEAGVLR